MNNDVTRDMIVAQVEKAQALVVKWENVRMDWVRLRDEALDKVVECDVAITSALRMHHEALEMLMGYDDARTFINDVVDEG